MKIVTAVQPTNNLTIGNYLGAIKEIVAFQEQGNDIYLFIADLHSITTTYDQSQLSKNTLNTIATYLACGIDPSKTTIFLQSAISEHSQLKHLLSPFVSFGDLTRMHQFKDKQTSQKYISLALLDYPVLMAADILLYKPDIIPVGLDQKQHIELMSSIAQRFNQKHPFFTIPKEHISSVPKVMSLVDPNKKMSKSDPNTMATIFLNDSEDSIVKKFKKATTDSLTSIDYSLEANRTGIKNLLDIYASFNNSSMTDVLDHFKNKQYGHLKKETGELVASNLKPIRTKIQELELNEKYLLEILKNGNEKAKKEAKINMEAIMTLMGFLR